MSEHADVSPELMYSILRSDFRFDEFRPGQREVIEAVLDKRDIVAVMPTGYGKSLCFQLASKLLPGLTVVISPLIALMKDQVDKIVIRGDTSATFLNSSISSGERARRLRGVASGKHKLVYLAPEALRNRAFVSQIMNKGVSLLTIDEAHCISQWGHDFRPDYLALRDFREALGAPPALAMTATATKRVRLDIAKAMNMTAPFFMTLSFNRPNLEFSVLRCHGKQQKLDKVRELLSQTNGGAAIIYVSSRKDAESVAQSCVAWGFKAAPYHAGMASEDRAATQEAFMDDRLQVICCTNAFGMGVDKPDIRLIIHHSMPASLEAYYQECGRAGRDGLPARVALLFLEGDRMFHERLLDADSLDATGIQNYCTALKRFKRNDYFLIPKGAMETAAGVTETQSRVALSLLGQAGMIERIPDCSATAFVCRRAVDNETEMGLSPDEKRLIAWLEARFGDDVFEGGEVDFAQLAGKLNISPDTLEELMISLRSQGVISFAPREQCIAAKRVQGVTTSVANIMKFVDNHKEDRRSKLNAMISYALSRRCRRSAIRAYFGEEDVAPECPACDVCLGAGRIEVASAPGGAGNWFDAADILRHIRAFRFPQGRTGAGKILCGPEYPLGGKSEKHARDILNRLLDAQLLEMFYKPVDDARRYPLLRLTADALLRLESGESIYVRLEDTPDRRKKPKAAPSPMDESSLSEIETELLERLRQWRVDKAKETGVPVFYIFSNKTLIDLVKRRPASMPEIELVYGIGTQKSEKFGEDILSILKNTDSSDAGRESPGEKD